MQLNPLDVPLSRFGSYLCVTSTWDHRRPLDEQSGWHVRWLRDAPNTYVFRIELIDGEGRVASPRAAEGEPGRLTLRSDTGTACDMTLADDDTLRVRVRGGGLRLITVAGAYCSGSKLAEDFWEVTPSGKHPRFGVRGRRGTLRGEARWDHSGKAAACKSVTVDLLPDADGQADASVHVYLDVCLAAEDARPFDTIVESIDAEFARWYAAFAPPRDAALRDAHALAAYVLWVSTVAPYGLYPSPVVWGSKNWMTRVWSWDH